jgi:Fic family protein
LLYRLSGNAEITEDDILGLHRLFYMRIDAGAAGKYRDKNVIITGTDFEPPSPSEVPQLMRSLIDELPSLKRQHPVEYAASLHIRLATIHPFVDGNGRTARLLMNLALLQAGYPITIIPPLLRGDYIAAIREANKGICSPFVDFITACVWESQREYLRILGSLDRE